MPDKARFSAELKRLYDRRGVEFNPAQARVYWEVLGGRDKVGEDLFTDGEIHEAVNRALLEPAPQFGIPDVQRLRQYIIEARTHLGARVRNAPGSACTPEGLAAFSRAWREALGRESS